MNLYSITNWNNSFEINRTRELKKMTWVPLPNKMDGDGFTEIMAHDCGTVIFGIWVLMVELASKCDPRGTLLRDSAVPHDFQSLSRMTRAKEAQFLLAVPILVGIGWLTVQEITGDTVTDIPQDSAEEPQAPAPSRTPASGKGTEGKGIIGDGREGNPSAAFSLLQISEIITDWNEVTKQESDDRTQLYREYLLQLSMGGVRVEDCKLVTRHKNTEWAHDPEMTKNLKIKTVFKPQKFSAYLDEARQWDKGGRKPPGGMKRTAGGAPAANHSVEDYQRSLEDKDGD